MLKETIKQYLIDEGYGTATDPMIIEVPPKYKLGFQNFLREQYIQGRWVNLNNFVFDFLKEAEYQQLWDDWTSSEYLLFYIPDTTHYIYAKMRWADVL